MISKSRCCSWIGANTLHAGYLARGILLEISESSHEGWFSVKKGAIHCYFFGACVCKLFTCHLEDAIGSIGCARDYHRVIFVILPPHSIQLRQCVV